MAGYRSSFWAKSPFLKLLLALMAGILFQWHSKQSPSLYIALLCTGLMGYAAFGFLPLFKKYRFGFITGILVVTVFFSIGGWLTWQKDIRNNTSWFGHSYPDYTALQVTLDEPLVEKNKSFKANATVNYLLQNDKKIKTTGKIIIYFRKDSSLNLAYGSQLIFQKALQEIKNSGNPGGFDYKRYCLFQGITHQVYLTPNDFEALPGKKTSSFRQFIFNSRERVLEILRKYIKGEKETGLAEALLIGYKDDLDQALVQSYTNTGVVHIIAISGLHLGLIYWLLALLLRPLQKNKKWRWLHPVLIITCLWLFSFLAGAQPSVLRSALMFSFIVIGDSFSRRSFSYNTLAVSAFLLLCINPFWLWDVGFQLSYAAVLSIIVFLQPVYNWLYIKNKLLDFVWKLNAVTIAAQVLTLPLSIYHFHQFPLLFLFSNFLAVPLSSLILIGEILLCGIAFISPVAHLLGDLLSWLIRIMNTYIERVEFIPFSLWDGLQVTAIQTILLFISIAAISYWLLNKAKPGLVAGLMALALFALLRSYSFITAGKQQKIIVYNVPGKKAIDFVEGRKYYFSGDSSLLADGFERNFHLKPSRIFYRIHRADTIPGIYNKEQYISYAGKRLLLADGPIAFPDAAEKPVINLLVVSGNKSIRMEQLDAALDIKQVVTDGSVPAWRAASLKNSCDSLKIPCHNVTVKGAFVMNW